MRERSATSIVRVALPSRAARIARVVGVLLLAAAVAAVGVRAGFWQLGRHEARADAIAAYEANADLPAASLAEAVGPDDAVAGDEEWRRVRVTGVIDADSLTLLRNRPVDRERAYQLLVWLDTADGESFLLNAGWIPIPAPTEDLAAPDWPDGEVTITAVLRRAEPDDGRRDEGATRITPVQMPVPSGQPLNGYGVVQEPCGDDGCVGYGAPVPLPRLSLGPHLAYAWQWFAFALIVPVAGVMLARREWQLTGGAPVERARRVPRPSRRRRSPSDEEIEDAL